MACWAGRPLRAQEVTDVAEQRRRQIRTGIALILVGAGLYVVQRFEGLERTAIFFLLSGAFLAAYFYRREFGLLIPAGLIGGLGVGMFEAVPLLAGIGGGFVAVTLIALIYERRFEGWPLIPGTILILVGLRETEILQLIVSGKTNKKIAQVLYRTERTVEYHRNRLMRKLGAKTAADLVKRAITMGIIS